MGSVMTVMTDFGWASEVRKLGEKAVDRCAVTQISLAADSALEEI
jgi:hypothetical protein